MATQTPNLNLKKPATSDFYNVADQNGNMDLIDAAMILRLLKTDASALYMGNRNLNWVGGGQMQWGVTANVFSWSSQMRILNAGGKLLVDGAALNSILIAAGSVTLANAWDCAYITIPSADAQTVTLSVAQYNAIPAGNNKLILAIRDADSCLEMLGGGWVTYGTTVEAGGKRDNYIPKSLVTAANDFIVAIGNGAVAKKTLAETKTILGITSVMPLNGGTLESYSEKLLINAAATGTVTMDLAVQDVYKLTLTGATTLAFSNVPTTGKAVSVTVAIVQGATPYAVTYPASVKWANDAIPNTSVASKTHFLTFITFDGGTRWYGFASGLNFTT